MIVRCNYCSNIYDFPESNISDEGFWFGCSSCGEIFHVGRSFENVKPKAEPGGEGIDSSDILDNNEKEQNVAHGQSESDIDLDEGNQSDFALNSDTPPDTDWEGVLDDCKTFNWRELRVDDERGGQELSDDSEQVSSDGSSGTPGVEPSNDNRISRVTMAYYEVPEIDMEVLSRRTSSRLDLPYYQPNPLSYGTRKSRGGTFKKSLNYLMALLVVIIFAAAALTILISLELVSGDKISAYANYVSSRFSVALAKITSRGVEVTGSVGRWVNTRSGVVYLVSGQITNNSGRVVSFVRLQGDFNSAGENVFKQTVYAGNTLSANELRTLPVEDTIVKLNRKSGDVDFSDARRLAGLNRGIRPGESIPFYIVFPSKKKILGLKYDIEVLDFENESGD